jgi:hypothetical protein
MTTTTTTANYAVGSNMPGYLPDGDVWITSDYRSAREALKADIEAACTTNYDIDVERSSYEDVADEAQEFFDVVDSTTEAEFNGFEFHYDGSVFWMMTTDETPDDV